jgi:hypothetical protein
MTIDFGMLIAGIIMLCFKETRRVGVVFICIVAVVWAFAIGLIVMLLNAAQTQGY